MTAQMSVSLDGFSAGPNLTDMDDWIGGTEAAGFVRISRRVIDAEAWREPQG